MSKSSEEAMGLADRFTLNAIRAAHALKQDFCTDAGCVCGGHQLVRDAALTIDAAIQRAVERERERCADKARIACENWWHSNGTQDDLLTDVPAAIRTPPPTTGG